MKDEKRAGLILVFGRRGTGKSKFLRDLIRETYSDQLVLVHDPVCDWQEWSEKEPFPPNVHIYSDMSAEDIATLAIKNAPCTLVYDEIQVALPTVGIPAPSAREIVARGRHLRVALVGGSQRPAMIDPSIRALYSTVVSFKMTNARDLQWLEQNVVSEFARKVALLENGEYEIFP